MKIRLLVFVLVLGWRLPAQTSKTDDAHARKLADIQRLLELTGGEKVANEMFDTLSANLLKSTGPESAGAERFLREFRKELDVKKMIEIVATAYDRNLSDEDVRALIRFYESPAGQHMLAAMPNINREMIEQVTALGQEAAKRVLKRLEEKDK